MGGCPLYHIPGFGYLERVGGGPPFCCGEKLRHAQCESCVESLLPTGRLPKCRKFATLEPSKLNYKLRNNFRTNLLLSYPPHENKL